MLLDFKGFCVVFVALKANMIESNHLIDESLHGFQINGERKKQQQQHQLRDFFIFAKVKREKNLCRTIYNWWKRTLAKKIISKKLFKMSRRFFPSLQRLINGNWPKK